MLFTVCPQQLAATAPWMITLAATWEERLQLLKHQAERPARARAAAPLQSRTQNFGPTNSSSRATAARRATEIVVGLEYRHSTPSRSSASPHSRKISPDRFTNRYRG